MALVLAVLAARLAYTWLAGVYTLVEDEAHYWEWSRWLEWSYYSKGPGIAWLIRLATEAMGTSEAAIRTPAVVASALVAFAAAGMARSIYNDGRAAFVAAAMVCLIPIYQAIALLMTIDGPYLACWAVACWSGLVALRRGGRVSWLVLGVALAFGFLFKYTIVLLVPGLVLFALVHLRSLVLAPGWAKWLVVSCVIALLGLVPVAVWNAQHDWATVRHLLGHAGLPGGDQQTAPGGRTLDPMSTLEFIGVQFGVVGPLLVVMLAACFGRASRRSDLDTYRGDRALCVWCAAPILLGYGALSLFTGVEGNWPIAAYASLIPLAAGQVVRAKDRVRARTAEWRAMSESERPRWGILRKRPEAVSQIAWDWAVGFGLVAGVCMLRLDLLTKLPWPGEGAAFERVVARLTEADTRAASTAKLMEQLRTQTGLEPFAMAQQYGRSSQLAFYLPGRPTAYATSSLMAGRRTQYDEWPHTDLRSPAVNSELLGRPAVMIGATAEQWLEAFERVELIGPLAGERKKGRDAYLGYSYRGFEHAIAGNQARPEQQD